MTSDYEATYSIACGDSDEKSWDEDGFSEYYSMLENLSPLLASMWAYLPM